MVNEQLETHRLLFSRETLVQKRGPTPSLHAAGEQKKKTTKLATETR
jgi:hypothetical protein